MSSPASRPTPDLIIDNATVLTANASAEVLTGASIEIAANRITAVGVASRDAVPTAQRIDARGAIVAPGFVNCHAHLAMTLFRGFADDLNLQGFLDRLIPVETSVVSPETVAIGLELAIAESLLSGITTTLDMYFHPDVAAASAKRTGKRIANGPVVFSFPGPDKLPFDERMQWADTVLRNARAQGELTSNRWLCPHGTYTIERAHLEAVRDLAAKHEASVTIHASENAAEVEMVVGQHGRRPVELLHDLDLLCAHTVLAHAVELTDHEIELLAATGASVSHNPLSNMKLASGFARVPAMLRAGVGVGLGTDGVASSNDLDIYGAMRFAATIHKGREGDASIMNADTVFRMATIDGARVLGLEAEIGSIEVGKRADLQVLWHNRPNLVPSYDPVSTFVYAAGRGDVRSVIVDGRVVVDDGEAVTVDVDSAMEAATQLAASIRQR